MNSLKNFIHDTETHNLNNTLKRNIDWNYIFNTVKENKITTIFYESMKRNGKVNLIPPKIRQELERTYYAIAFHNTRACEELRYLINILNQANIEVIVLKGIAFAHHLWGNVTLREINDIDMLVRENDVLRAEKILTELGYIPLESYKPREWYRTNHFHLAPYYNPRTENRAFIEIHRNIVRPESPYYTQIDEFWKRSLTVEMENLKIRILCPEHSVILICLHLTYYDSFIGQIRYLADIAKYAHYYKSNIDWTFITKKANKLKLGRYIYYPLYFTKNILDADISHELLNSLNPDLRPSFIKHLILKILVSRYALIPHDSYRILPKWRLKKWCLNFLSDS